MVISATKSASSQFSVGVAIAGILVGALPWVDAGCGFVLVGIGVGFRPAESVRLASTVLAAAVSTALALFEVGSLEGRLQAPNPMARITTIVKKRVKVDIFIFSNQAWSMLLVAFYGWYVMVSFGEVAPQSR
jgi:hypothetical protein